MMATAPAVPTIGRMQEFNPANESISAYLERFTLYVSVNGIAEDKRAPTLLLVLGLSHYSLIRGLVSPQKPENKTLDELSTLLKKHFDPEPVVIAERFQYYQRTQGSGESVSEFLAGLRMLASRCKFGTFLSEALRDRLVCGLNSESIQKALLAKQDLTLDSALETALSMESAAKKAKEMKDKASANSSVHKLTSKRGSRQGAASISRLCDRCGRGKHSRDQCKFKTATCHLCGKVGHISPVCRSKPTTSSNQSAKWLTTESDSSKTETLYTTRDHSSRPGYHTSSPVYQVKLEINNKPLVMEIDTGAGVSIIPESVLTTLLPELSLQRAAVRLKTFTGEVIPVKGAVTVDVTYGQKTYPKMELLVVQGEGPCLLGRSWLSKIPLDWRRIGKVVTDKSTPQDRLDSLLQCYQDVFSDSLGTITPHKATLNLKEGTTPRFFKPRPVPYALRKCVGEELDHLEKLGVIEKARFSEWAAPIVVVPKKDSRIRICGDYKVTINPSLDVDQYPLPRPEDIFASLAGGTKFTILDLMQAFNQLQLDDQSKKLVTVNTHQGLYSYTRLPFGVASAPAVFQRTMESILQGIDGVACYIDDIIITGKSAKEHLDHLEDVLKRLAEHGVHAKKDKCRFFQDSVEFLGHKIDAEGIHATPDKLRAIVDAPSPQNATELRSFLGLLNYYGKFIPQAATILHPLNALLCKDAKWMWSEECRESFEAAKGALTSSSLLAHYDSALPIRLAADASAYGIGAVIAHVLPDGSERPIAFASRTLTSSEKNYAQIEKEALALVYGVKRFHAYIYGRHFTLVTDHKPLKTILGPKTGIPTLAAARLQRWAWILSAYRYDIEFRPTNEHANADGLSRLPLSSGSLEEACADPTVFNVSQIEALPVNVSKLRSATATDPILSKVYRYVKAGWPVTIPKCLRPYHNRQHELTVEEGCVMWGMRVLIPNRLEEKLLTELHTDHPGATRMKSIARSYMWWPGMDKAIESMAGACTSCHSAKKAPPTAPLQPWSWPAKPWQRVHLDFAGPFQGSTFIIAVDAYSKWPEVRVMNSTTVSKTLDVLRDWFGSHGLPHQLVTDNGPQFVAQEFDKFCKSNGIKHVRSAPYHPASNGLVERFVQTLKQSLKATLNDGRSLSHRLSSFLLTYRTTVHATTRVAPCELLCQRHLPTRLDLLQPDPEKSVLNRQSSQKESHDGRTGLRTWTEGDNVMVRDFRQARSWTAAVIFRVLGPVTYLVETTDGLKWKRHTDQIKSVLKPACTLNPPDETEEAFPEVPNDSSMDNAETSTGEIPVPDAGNRDPDVHDDVSGRRYPDRARRCPDRYK